MLNGTNPSLPPQSLQLSVVVPVYGSEDCLSELVYELMRELRPTGWTYEIILVNDFSRDGSWQVIESLCRQHPCVVGIDLRRNFGQDNAILTGIRLTRGSYVAVMDDDLQHDPKYLRELVHKAGEGFDVVLAEFRTKDQKAWKNLGSWFNGKIAELVLYKPKGLYLSPYKVIRRDVAEMICHYLGPAAYIDGLLFQATWRVTSILVEHRTRYAGQGNYGFWRSAGVTARLLFSFSVRPVRLVAWTGIATSCLAIIGGASAVAFRSLAPQSFPPQTLGWASLIVTILLLGGLQLLFLGILGEYVGRTYLCVNDKPQTSVRQVINSAIYQEAMIRGDRDL